MKGLISNRSEIEKRLSSEEFDLIVIGGGVTGAGVLLDAALRNLNAVLIEKGDIASGTSSKSSKLVHGGLRYLQQKEVLLVYESLRERQRLLMNAPYLVKPLPFLIPIFGKNGIINKTVARFYTVALVAYDLTGGLRIGKPHKRLKVEEAYNHFPALKRDRLVAGFLYYDAKADDARLTLTIAKTAAEHGALVATYYEVKEFDKRSDGKATGVKIVSSLGDNTEITVSAKKIVNATGVWADEISAIDDSTHNKTITPAKGIHITVPFDRLPCDIATVLPVRKDGRSIFVIPWGGETYIGTTDTDYKGSFDNPELEEDDATYLLNAVNDATTANLTLDDITGTWAGLRPLLSDTAHFGSEKTKDLSRKHRVTRSKSGVITITGGKLTTYRKMAQDTVDEVIKDLGIKARRSKTKAQKLVGAENTSKMKRLGSPPKDPLPPSMSDAILFNHLYSRYGSISYKLLNQIEKDPFLKNEIVPGLPYTYCEVKYAVESELALTLDDIMSRRTRAVLHDGEGSIKSARAVAEFMAQLLNWSTDEIENQITLFTDKTTKELSSLRSGN